MQLQAVSSAPPQQHPIWDAQMRPYRGPRLSHTARLREGPSAPFASSCEQQRAFQVIPLRRALATKRKVACCLTRLAYETAGAYATSSSTSAPGFTYCVSEVKALPSNATRACIETPQPLIPLLAQHNRPLTTYYNVNLYDGKNLDEICRSTSGAYSSMQAPTASWHKCADLLAA